MTLGPLQELLSLLLSNSIILIELVSLAESPRVCLHFIYFCSRSPLIANSRISDPALKSSIQYTLWPYPAISVSRNLANP